MKRLTAALIFAAGAAGAEAPTEGDAEVVGLCPNSKVSDLCEVIAPPATKLYCVAFDEGGIPVWAANFSTFEHLVTFRGMYSGAISDIDCRPD